MDHSLLRKTRRRRREENLQDIIYVYVKQASSSVVGHGSGEEKGQCCNVEGKPSQALATEEKKKAWRQAKKKKIGKNEENRDMGLYMAPVKKTKRRRV